MAKNINKEVLVSVGLGNTTPSDYFQKEVTLRDGRSAVVWIHKKTGHGILDYEFWEKHDYYNEEYRREHGPEIGRKVEPSDSLQIYNALNEKQFNTFSAYLSVRTRFLEIGSSFGGILHRVANTGVATCHGIEPNKEDAAFLQSNNKQAKIYNSTFENASLPENFYDVVVSIEVLEHTVSPRNCLNKCFSVMLNGGFLHIEVPNHYDVLLSTYKDTGYDKFYYHKAHIHYFTEKSLQMLCNDCGFHGEVFSFLMYPFFNHVWWQQNHCPQRHAIFALSTPEPANDTFVGKAINDFYKKMELEYERLINEFVLGDCLIFQGRKT